MLCLRHFEREACAQLEQGAVPGALHTSTGQEGAIIGACMALRDHDTFTGTHRSHCPPIARGASAERLMAELMGKKTGVCKGKGGSMHLADFGIGGIGQSGIVGGGIPLATGAGLSAQVLGSDRVCLCFFGDGASNQGTFHESLNMAAVWKLPVVYLCENNLYAATTPAADSTAVEDVATRAAAYGIPGEIVDGQDAVRVHEVVHRAVERARAGLGPSLIEAKTYRFAEHAQGVPIPGGYRSSEEAERWGQRDPIRIHRERLIAEGVLTEESAQQIERRVRAELSRAVEFALESDFPEPGEAFEDLYANPVSVAAPSPGSRARQVPSAPAAELTTHERAGSQADDDERREITTFQATFEALRQEMERDPRVILIGEDIAIFGATGLLPGFGPERLRSAPVSENSFAGMAVGAAMTGLRPVVDLTIASFFYLAMDQIVNQAAKLRYMSGGQAGIPAVFRACMWHNGSNAAQHSDRPYPMFMNVPGLKIVVPATPYDAKGLLVAAIRDDDPVLVFEDKEMWFQTGAVPEDDYAIPLGVADVKREGRDVTAVAVGGSVRHALEAAEQLSADGISLEVIDPRSLVPLDRRAILESVAKTERLVLVDPAHRTNGAAAEIAAIVAEEGFGELRAPILRVTTPDVQIPFSPALERPLYPSAEKIVAAVRQQVRP
jgi:2-oxoisovalerate dehydrogenase E1 component